MAKQKTQEEATDAPREGGILEKAAEAIGSTLGTISAKTGLAGSPKKSGKLPKTNKKRLPRKVKKRANKKKEKG